MLPLLVKGAPTAVVEPRMETVYPKWEPKACGSSTWLGLGLG